MIKPNMHGIHNCWHESSDFFLYSKSDVAIYQNDFHSFLSYIQSQFIQDTIFKTNKQTKNNNRKKQQQYSLAISHIFTSIYAFAAMMNLYILKYVTF